MEGKGILASEKGVNYSGEFKNGQMHGIGILEI